MKLPHSLIHFLKNLLEFYIKLVYRVIFSFLYKLLVSIPCLLKVLLITINVKSKELSEDFLTFTVNKHLLCQRTVRRKCQ